MNVEQFSQLYSQLYLDIGRKCENAEISTKALDLRGAGKLMEKSP